jgi:hypothetical protein
VIHRLHTTVLQRRDSVHVTRDICLNYSLLITVKHSNFTVLTVTRLFRGSRIAQSVRILTKLQGGRPSNRGSIPSKHKRLFFYLSPRPALRPPQPPSQYVPRTLSLALKWPEREADATSLFTSQVQNEFSYDSFRSLPYDKSIPLAKASSQSAN